MAGKVFGETVPSPRHLGISLLFRKRLPVPQYGIFDLRVEIPVVP